MGFLGQIGAEELPEGLSGVSARTFVLNRGTTAKEILYWVSRIWHPNCTLNCLIRKPLDSYTSFPALGFSGDIGPKITVSFGVIVSVSFSC